MRETLPKWTPRLSTVDRSAPDWRLTALAVELDNLDYLMNESDLIEDSSMRGLIEAGKELADQVAKTPAATLSGVLAKARAAMFLYNIGEPSTGDHPDDTPLQKLHGALVRDLLQMLGGRC